MEPTTMRGAAAFGVILALLIGVAAEIDVNERVFAGRPFLIGSLNQRTDLLDLDARSMGRNACWKDVQGREAGKMPASCERQHELINHRCYPICQNGYTGEGATCWIACPKGFQAEGGVCRRRGHIVSADVSGCPANDACGLTVAKGCSKCPDGYRNNWCTCFREPKVIARKNYIRGTGKMPECGQGLEQHAGLCYHPCPTGHVGRGLLSCTQTVCPHELPEECGPLCVTAGHCKGNVKETFEQIAALIEARKGTTACAGAGFMSPLCFTDVLLSIAPYGRVSDGVVSSITRCSEIQGHRGRNVGVPDAAEAPWSANMPAATLAWPPTGVNAPEAGTPAMSPKAGASWAGSPEAGSPEAGSPEAGSPEAGSPEAGSPEAGSPEAHTPEAGSPEAGSPEVGSPEAGWPEAGSPEAGAPEAGWPEAGSPEAGSPEASSPEAGSPEAGSPEAGWPEAGFPEAGSPDAGSPEAGSPDAGSPEVGWPEAGSPEARSPEAGSPEAGSSEAGSPDAGSPETGSPEAGSPEAGAPEAGVPEAGVPEAGVPEAGVPEAGVSEAGVPEAGVPEAGVPEVGSPEVSSPEASVPEAGSHEARTPEAATPVAGSPEASAQEARTPASAPESLSSEPPMAVGRG